MLSTSLEWLGEVGIREPWHFCLESHFSVARIQTLVCCEHCCWRHKNPTCARPAAGRRDVGSGHCQHLYMLEDTNLPASCRRVVSDPTSIFQNSYLCYLISTTQFTFRYKGKIQILASLCPWRKEWNGDWKSLWKHMRLTNR